MTEWMLYRREVQTETQTEWEGWRYCADNEALNRELNALDNSLFRFYDFGVQLGHMTMRGWKSTSPIYAPIDPPANISDWSLIRAQ